MAPSTNEDLNPEPSQPAQRKEHRLTPKTYAAATEENLDVQVKKENLKGEVKTVTSSTSTQPNGQGKDDAPQSSGRTTPTQYVGRGENEAPRSPTPKSHRRPKSNGSLRTNGHKLEEEPAKSIEERYKDKDGERLTSIKPATDDETALVPDETALVPDETRLPGGKKDDNQALVSGRQAGAGWEMSGVRFAPMNIPLKRRLQTLIVLFHTLSIVGLLAFFFLMCSIPLFWPLLFPYTIYILFSRAGTSGNLSYRSEFIRRLRIWSLFASYFPARLHRSAPLPPTRKYIFGYHPHGIISHGAFVAFATEALGFSQLFPGITNTLLTLDANFRIPFYRDYALAMGLASVSRESCENLLTRGGANGEGMGRAITIVVGGARESLDAQPRSLRLVLKRRKGFVKLAIRTGADLVPVLSFGENDLYEQVHPDSHPAIYKIQMGIKKLLGFTVPLFHARGVFNYDYGMLPYRHPLNVVVGRPIKVEQHAKPDEAYLDELHAKYVQELERIWEEWKDVFARDRKGELQILE
ncbi:diacylglycerol O-acyltransferase 1 [Hypocenomyce scalaris]|nr:diacylglycerol O-acyltransferase 1 [Hypocenomyce scalaris]